MMKPLPWNDSTCGRLFCAVLLLGGISVHKRVGHNVYRMIHAVSASVRPNVPLTLGSRADLSSLLAVSGSRLRSAFALVR